MRKALVVGIDKYPTAPLSGCENDAAAIANTLETNGDGSPNFSVKLLSSDKSNVTSEAIHSALEELFAGDAETALFYFAGHGIVNPSTNAGHIVSQDGKKGSWGVSLSDILAMANAAYPRINSTVIILDSCNSGYAGEVAGLGNEHISAIGSGVTILTACHRDGTAAEDGSRGLFTSILLDGLSGASADILGRITPASVYSHIDQTLGAWEQRPIYKANVQTFITLRNVAPRVPPEVLRRFPIYFKNPTDIFPLDPSFEPDRGEETNKLKAISVNDENVRKYRELQMCNRYGLVIPVDQPHMWHAAIHSTGCKLTALGAHFRKLAEMGRI
jgi:hypothetical protein